MIKDRPMNCELILPVETPYEENVDKEIERNLITSGEIFVQKGDEVSPADVIGECYVSKGFRIFNVAETIGIKKEEIEQYLKKELGAKVFKGEVLAERKQYLGIVTRQFVVSCDGILEAINASEGQITIRFLPEKMKLLSGFYGEVSEVDKNKGVRIKTQVHIIKGQIGVGNQREGVLKVAADDNRDIAAIDIDADYSRKVVLAGSVVTKDLVQKCVALGVKGIIGGGINFRDYQSLVGSLNPREDVGISLLLLTGFGRCEVNVKIIELMRKYQHRHVIINSPGKELIIPLSRSEWVKKSKGKTKKLPLLRLESEVIILSWPYLGKRGLVTRINSQVKDLRSMITVTVKIAQEKKITLPARNLGLIHPAAGKQG